MTVGEQKKIFNEWLSKHKGLVFKVTRSYATIRDDRDDLFQEIAIQLWNSIPGFRKESKASTWIYKVALYTAMGWSKKQRKHAANKDDLSERIHVLRPQDETQDNPLNWLYDQINQLEKVDRSIILLVLDGFSYKKISSMLGISENHVGVKVHRIKKSLTELSKKFNDYGI
jgi:RNA polymerase sigma-70 factor (ECF subfamily)